MNGVGISCGLIGCTTVIATVYMMERGYKWWQIAILVLIARSFAPQYRRDEVD